ncbi:hypothetical protein Lal_00003978, partial [Lupinus albus]
VVLDVQKICSTWLDEDAWEYVWLVEGKCLLTHGLPPSPFSSALIGRLDLGNIMSIVLECLYMVEMQTCINRTNRLNKVEFNHIEEEESAIVGQGRTKHSYLISYNSIN